MSRKYNLKALTSVGKPARAVVGSISNRAIMNLAWRIAREGAEKFGGKASQYIAAAMRRAWAWAKRKSKPAAPVTTKPAGLSEGLLAAAARCQARYARSGFTPGFRTGAW